MAYVRGFEYDVFISYARVDDEPDAPGGERWISVFQEYLLVALRKRLGGTGDLRLFFDRSEMKSNDELRALELAARNSAVFVCVCSRSYVEREFTLRELAAFEQQPDASKRLFAIEIMPLDDSQSYPPILQDRHREQFYVQTSGARGTPVPIPANDPGFGHMIHDLAEDIRTQLFAMRAMRDIQNVTGDLQRAEPGLAGRAPDASGADVVLGQTTEDLDYTREQLRRYLQQFGHVVLPRGEMRQDRPGFEADIRAALSGAEYFVQILGAFKGRGAPDIPQGYVRLQLDIAKEMGVPVVQWCSAEIRREDVTDPEHHETLTATDVIVSGFEAFKSELNMRLTRKAETAAAPDLAELTDQSLPMIFINADKSDLAQARALRDEFVRNGFLAAIPLDQGDERDMQSYLRDNLLDCDGLVMIYGDTTPVWASRNLRHFNKLRATRDVPPKLVAVIIGPPDEKASDLGVAMPGLRVVGSTEAWQPEAVDDLIKALSS